MPPAFLANGEPAVPEQYPRAQTGRRIGAVRRSVAIVALARFWAAADVAKIHHVAKSAW
jgi:hypothetical protein